MTNAADDLLTEVLAFIENVNSGTISEALRRLTDDVCITEDIAPFRWSGAEAGGQWLAAMEANAQRLGVTSIIMNPGEPHRIEIEGEHGYCILPGVVTLERPDGSLQEDGLITLAMRFEAGHWRISALTWTGGRPRLA